ncbi:amidohydrolase family protein [Mangrovivirga sp. M17]|uniref:Amidohydrolase family protein n=1 Tax=Mangrovivirga halotolerans TaxID=2993936 RepID=A0ABT3RQG2_9BACT|nr:amidohydrolase family protein [Mangrovivirga halotolerans]MCX2743721.1 amidohydrolase family protein [Mangrovivirga halotolerans]
MKSIVLTLGLLILLLPGCNRESDRESVQLLGSINYAEPIIDMHMHTGLPEEIPEGIPAICRPSPCEGTGKSVVNPIKLMRATIEAMDKYNIEKAFLSGVDWDVVQQWNNASPDRFIPSPFILNPEEVGIEALKEEYIAKRFKGMGEIGTQLNGIKPNDPSLEPYFQLAEEMDIPVLIHAAGIGPYMPNFRSSSGSPLLLEEVLIKHPKLRLYVENAGYPYRDQMIAMMYQYPQLYADVSTITWVIPREAFYDYLKAFIHAGLGKRIMFGTDQMVWPDKIGAAVEAIKEAPFLTKDQKRDIFYNNAVQFLSRNDKEKLINTNK